MTFRTILYSFLPMLLDNESLYVLVSFLVVFLILIQACVFVDFADILSSSVENLTTISRVNYKQLNLNTSTNL